MSYPAASDLILIMMPWPRQRSPKLGFRTLKLGNDADAACSAGITNMHVIWGVGGLLKLIDCPSDVCRIIHHSDG
jgi:hypothetical protein